MSIAGLIICAAAVPFAAADLAGIAALIIAITGAITAIIGLVRPRRNGDDPPDKPQEVTELIRVVQDLERCKLERNTLSSEVDYLRAEVLRFVERNKALENEIARLKAGRS